jgi:chromosome partitioning related protein ParA
MSIVISFVSTKGGCGKTTLCANLAALAAAVGQRVLMVDADIQPSLSKYFELESPATQGMAEVIQRGGVITQEHLKNTTIPNLDIIVSNMTDATQVWLKQREDRLVLMKRAVRQPVVQDNYDLVLIDTQGSTGELQRCAAMAADLMVSPLKPDVLNYSEFGSGTMQLLSSLNSMADFSADFQSGQMCLLINAMERTRNAIALTNVIRGEFRKHPSVRLLDTVVPASTIYPTARTLQQPVHVNDRPSQAWTGRSAYEVMHGLLHELMPHLKGVWAGPIPPTEETQGGA